jgi:hypothetical protein
LGKEVKMQIAITAQARLQKLILGLKKEKGKE